MTQANPTGTTKTRLQIDLSPEQMNTMDSMQDACGIATRKELFNNALSLLEWAIQEVQRDRIITALDLRADRYVELRMPALSHASKRNSNGTSKQRRIERDADTA